MTLPRRTSSTFAMYYDDVEASRFGLGGKDRRTALGTALMRFTDAEAPAATARLLELPNVANGSIFAAHTTQEMTHSIRFKTAAGTDYYIMCTNAATNRS